MWGTRTPEGVGVNSGACPTMRRPAGVHDWPVSLSVLIVDDERAFCAHADRLLGLRGFDVDGQAGDGAGAVRDGRWGPERRPPGWQHGWGCSVREHRREHLAHSAPASAPSGFVAGLHVDLAIAGGALLAAALASLAILHAGAQGNAACGKRQSSS